MLAELHLMRQPIGWIQRDGSQAMTTSIYLPLRCRASVTFTGSCVHKLLSWILIAFSVSADCDRVVHSVEMGINTSVKPFRWCNESQILLFVPVILSYLLRLAMALLLLACNKLDSFAQLEKG